MLDLNSQLYCKGDIGWENKCVHFLVSLSVQLKSLQHIKYTLKHELQNVLLQDSCHNHFTFNIIERCKFVKSRFNFTLSTVISGLKCSIYLIRLQLTFSPWNAFTAKRNYKLIKLLTFSKDKTIRNNISFICNSIEKTESKYSKCLWQFKQKPIM